MRNIPPWLVQLSVKANEVTCGPSGWTVCARCYASRAQGKRRGYIAVAIIDRIFWFDPRTLPQVLHIAAHHQGELMSTPAPAPKPQPINPFPPSRGYKPAHGDYPGTLH